MPKRDITLQSGSYLGGSSPTEKGTPEIATQPQELKYPLRKGHGDQGLLCEQNCIYWFLNNFSPFAISNKS